MGIMGSAEESNPLTEREVLISMRAQNLMDTLCDLIQADVMDPHIQVVRGEYNRVLGELRDEQIMAERALLLQTLESAYQNEVARKGKKIKIDTLRDWADELSPTDKISK